VYDSANDLANKLFMFIYPSCRWPPAFDQPRVTFPATKHHRPSASNNLNNLVTSICPVACWTHDLLHVCQKPYTLCPRDTTNICILTTSWPLWLCYQNQNQI